MSKEEKKGSKKNPFKDVDEFEKEIIEFMNKHKYDIHKYFGYFMFDKYYFLY